MTFPWHLEVLIDFYGNESTYGVQTNAKFALVFHAILSSWDLGAQQGFFKLTMKSNASQAIVEVAAFGN
jgi:hypothetical protein